MVLNSRHSSLPDIPGSFRSSSTALGGCLRNVSSPEIPSEAICTCKESASSNRCSVRCMGRLSSTTSTVSIVFVSFSGCFIAFLKFHLQQRILGLLFFSDMLHDAERHPTRPRVITICSHIEKFYLPSQRESAAAIEPNVTASTAAECERVVRAEEAPVC